MRNEVKIEIETADGQIVWKHFKFPSWKLTEKWASGFLGFLTQALKTGNTKVKTIQDQTKVPRIPHATGLKGIGAASVISPSPPPKIKDPEQNPVMRAEVEIILRNLGVKKKDTKRILDRAGPCHTVEEMVRKCLTKSG